ncbi:MAG: LacI family DNA-binding transcriptional regulator [Planctomycetota bacterium]
MMTPTIQEIATRAGVSPGTVSRVLNGRNKENRPAIARRAEHIRQLAQEMGYRPNAAARSMISGRFGTMAFVTCGDLGFDWFPPALLHGVHTELDDRGYRLVMNELAGTELTSEIASPWLFREQAVDAILLHLDAKIPGALERFHESHPSRVVLLNANLERDCVFPDEVAGGMIAGQHLIAAGHRAIGYFFLDQAGEPHFSATDRRRGLEISMLEAGLAPALVLADADRYDPMKGNGTERAAAFLRAHPHCTAVVCYSMAEFTSMLSAALADGRHVPGDLTLLLFHDQPAHAVTGIATDTIIVPFASMGAASVSMAIDLIDGGASSLPARKIAYTELFDASIGRRLSISATGSGSR